MSEVVASTLALLSPYLPYLVKGIKVVGEKAAEKVGEKSGELAAEKAQKVWNVIKRKKGASADKVKTAAEELSKNADDTDWQLMFTKGLTQLLCDDPKLLDEIMTILEVVSGQQVLSATGNTNAEVKQKMIGGGKQKMTLKDNLGIKINQSKE